MFEKIIDKIETIYKSANNTSNNVNTFIEVVKNELGFSMMDKKDTAK